MCFFDIFSLIFILIIPALAMIGHGRLYRDVHGLVHTDLVETQLIEMRMLL